METSLDLSQLEGMEILPEEISGIPAEIDRLKADQAARADNLSPKQAEILARIVQLEEIEKCSQDLRGTKPAELLGEDAQELCAQFLAGMKKSGYRLSTVIGTATESARLKKPKTWRAYPIGRALSTADEPGGIYVNVYLAQDGKFRTRTGGAIPPGLQFSIGKTVTEKSFSYADDSTEIDLIQRKIWIEMPLAEKLDGITGAAGLARVALS